MPGGLPWQVAAKNSGAAPGQRCGTTTTFWHGQKTSGKRPLQARRDTMNKQNMIEEISMKDLEQRIEFSCCGGGNEECDAQGGTNECHEN
jgi:hypothetical protein